MSVHNIRLAGFAALFALIATVSGSPLDSDRKKGDETARTMTIPENAMDEADRARDAAEIIKDRTAFSEVGIPLKLLEEANAIAVIPNYVQGALGFGGSYGKGLFARRDESGSWLPPSFIRLSGGSFGLQIGVQATDLILVFKDEKAAERLLKGRLKLGAEASAAVGPLGRDAEIGTVLFRDGVYSYSRSKGAFVGIALNGAVLTIDDHANSDAYGTRRFGDEIVLEGEVDVNDVVRPFMEALGRPSHTPSAQTSACVESH
jgi:lipid-binding SYLF domain-containing protein